MNKASLSSPYVSNYHCSITLRSDSDHKGYIFDYSVTSYRLHVHHLNVPKVAIPVRFYQEHSFPSDEIPEMEHWVRNFKAEIGNKVFDRNDLKFTTQHLGENILFQIVLHTELIISEDVDVCFTAEFWALQNDPVQMVFARYPSQGFHVNLVFSDEFKYDCGWFIQCDPLTDMPPRGRIDISKNGISARMNDWILPGEGVALYYYESH